VLSILLARWMPRAEYGEFAFSYGALTLATFAHSALVGEPLAVIEAQEGSSRDVAVSRSTAVHSLFIGIVTTVSALALFGLALRPASAISLPTAISTGLAIACASGVWYQRRLAYFDGRPTHALKVSLTYAASLAGALMAVTAAPGPVSSADALLVVAVAGIATTAMGAWTERRSWKWNFPSRAAAVKYWQYGRWSLTGALAGWFVANGFIALFVLRGQPERAAELRVAINFVWPFQHALVGLTALFLPALARSRLTSTDADFSHSVQMLAVQLTTAGVVYSLPIVLFRGPLLRLLYGETYLSAGPVVLAAGLVPVALGAQAAFTLALRAAGRPDLYLRAYLVAAAVVTAIIASTVGTLGSLGAAIGVGVAYVVLAVAAYALFVRHAHSIRGGHAG
jgi:O-antigen/teichoic acid export membrane protein